jgi:hypothetical protein
VTTLPALEAALDEAAHRYYGARRRRRARRPLLLGALAGAAGAAVLLLALPGSSGSPAKAPQRSGPAGTLALSRALADAPAIPPFRIGDRVVAHADLPAVADGFEDHTPYPPGHRDRFDWLSTAPGPYDMASIGYARDVRGLVEWRAACIWLRFWLDADGPPRQAAGRVLGDAPSWPTLRDHPGNWADVPGQVAVGDVAALTLHYRHDCSPWRDRQER